MRISDWSSDVCSSDLQIRYSGLGIRIFAKLAVHQASVVEHEPVGEAPSSRQLLTCNRQMVRYHKLFNQLGDREPSIRGRIEIEKPEDSFDRPPLHGFPKQLFTKKRIFSPANPKRQNKFGAAQDGRCLGSLLD